MSLYVIKTRNIVDEYLAYCSHKECYYLTDNFNIACRFKSLEYARTRENLEVIRESKYKVDIYKVIETIEFVEGV